MLRARRLLSQMVYLAEHCRDHEVPAAAHVQLQAGSTAAERNGRAKQHGVYFARAASGGEIGDGGRVRRGRWNERYQLFARATIGTRKQERLILDGLWEFATQEGLLGDTSALARAKLEVAFRLIVKTLGGLLCRPVRYRGEAGSQREAIPAVHFYSPRTRTRDADGLLGRGNWISGSAWPAHDFSAEIYLTLNT